MNGSEYRTNLQERHKKPMHASIQTPVAAGDLRYFLPDPLQEQIWLWNLLEMRERPVAARKVRGEARVNR
jgi:hypothetical protein